MSALRSGLYLGSVAHARLQPRAHRLRYRMFQLLLDLDEVRPLGRQMKLFSVNRFNLFSHHDRDHGEGRAGALRAWVEETLAAAGMPLVGGQILLLAMPRLLGHVFNPISLYFCHAPDGRLAAVLAEVNNTFGGRHTYVLEAGGEAEVLRASCAKAFHVSPFLDLAMSYEFALTAPGARVRAEVTGRDPQGRPLIFTTFHGRRRELSDLALLGAFLAYPLLTLKVVAAIHLEALKLWLKGVPMKPAPAQPGGPVTVVRSALSA